jgi:hypothetical protein
VLLSVYFRGAFRVFQAPIFSKGTAALFLSCPKIPKINTGAAGSDARGVGGLSTKPLSDMIWHDAKNGSLSRYHTADMHLFQRIQVEVAALNTVTACLRLVPSCVEYVCPTCVADDAPHNKCAHHSSKGPVCADVTIFVGDFGNEDVEVVRQVMAVSTAQVCAHFRVARAHMHHCKLLFVWC